MSTTTEQERAAYIAGDTERAELLTRIDTLQRALGDEVVRELTDGDYVLTEGAAWVEVQGFAVRLRATPEGLKIDVYKNGHEDGGELGSLFVGVDDAAPNI